MGYYLFPDIELLQKQMTESEVTDQYINDIRGRIQDVLEAFSLDAKIVSYKKSPLNVTFEFLLHQGQRFSELKNLTKEIEVSIGTPVKIYQSDEASPCCFLAVPHDIKEVVRIRDVIEGKEFGKSKSKLLIAAGIAENGAPIYVDFEESPHMLVTGTTGSGKTVFFDAIITSVLYRSCPDDVRLVLIDPTNTDFSVYNEIPHLLCPVISNKGEIYEVLKKISDEINYRNDMFSKKHVKDIDSYNSRSRKKLFHIVVLIDKYIKVSSEMPKDFENSIGKIAAQGRSVGIHIVINTQSSSSEVISGTIKNNLTCRVAFSMTTSIESRMAIDKTGAEKLTVPGEMLIDRGTTYPTVHARSPYISYNEIKRIVGDVNSKNYDYKYEPSYSVLHKQYAVKEDIKLVLRVLNHLTQTSRINVEKIQKLIGVSLPEAYEIVDMLEENGFIDPIVGSFHDVKYEVVMDAIKMLELQAN